MSDNLNISKFEVVNDWQETPVAKNIPAPVSEETTLNWMVVDVDRPETLPPAGKYVMVWKSGYDGGFLALPLIEVDIMQWADTMYQPMPLMEDGDAWLALPEVPESILPPPPNPPEEGTLPDVPLPEYKAPEGEEPPAPDCPVCPPQQPCPDPEPCPECPPCNCPECPTPEPTPPCPDCPICPPCQECPICPECPPREECPICPTCPAPEPCPECPVCPTCPEPEPCPTCPPPTVCPDPEPCPTCPECPTCPAEPEPEPTPEYINPLTVAQTGIGPGARTLLRLDATGRLLLSPKTREAGYVDTNPIYRGIHEKTINGNYMVGFPKFWTKWTSESGVYKFSISSEALEGYTVHPAFVDYDEVEHNFVYIGKYLSSVESNVAFSVPDKNVEANTPDNWALYSKKLTTLYGYPAHCMSAAHSSMLQLLMLVEYASTDLCSFVGNGCEYNATGLAGDEIFASSSWRGIVGIFGRAQVLYGLDCDSNKTYKPIGIYIRYRGYGSNVLHYVQVIGTAQTSTMQTYFATISTIDYYSKANTYLFVPSSYPSQATYSTFPDTCYFLNNGTGNLMGMWQANPFGLKVMSSAGGQYPGASRLVIWKDE